MKQHYKYKFELVGFPETKNRKVSGVYQIGNCYIGASKHIRKRILSHIGLSFNNNPSNKDKYIQMCVSNNMPIKVTLLSLNVFDEAKIKGKRDNVREKFYHEIYKK